MRTRLGLILLVIPLMVAGVQAQREFQFFVSMVDASGMPVATLAPSDLDVRESGVSGKVVRVEPIDWPVKVQILVDNGAGIGAENLTPLRNGVRGLLEALPDGVEVSLLSTAPQPRFLVRPTTDRQALLKGVDVLVPDNGAARFVEGLNEAAQRVEADEGNHFPVIVAVGSTAVEGGNVNQHDVERTLQRLGARAATVHVVMFSSTSRGTLNISGAAQTDIGIAVAKMTGGRYENITAGTRLATLLPEIGDQVALSHARQSRQYRITFERPGPATGPVGEITLGARPGTTVLLSIDGHLP
ncbi:MAG: VWA domain-containing protein [Acidobacteria bacterium]|nr:VWA domain-containing protein [Acidobacteriota bacterium]